MLALSPLFSLSLFLARAVSLDRTTKPERKHAFFGCICATERTAVGAAPLFTCMLWAKNLRFVFIFHAHSTHIFLLLTVRYGILSANTKRETQNEARTKSKQM